MAICFPGIGKLDKILSCFNFYVLPSSGGGMLVDLVLQKRPTIEGTGLVRRILQNMQRNKALCAL